MITLAKEDDFEVARHASPQSLPRHMTVTELIDGANCCVYIEQRGSGWLVGAQSRNRVLTVDNDHYGFAEWVSAEAEALVELLGPGRHYGEWWGAGINRNYGLSERRWTPLHPKRQVSAPEIGIQPLPMLYEGAFTVFMVQEAIEHLRCNGSMAAPGFMEPEGVLIFGGPGWTVFRARFGIEVDA
ncbi:RNA ligase family protein [Micromonospora sp. NBC_01813]|uniref:RNA ligase family protein n=1 Tax=Micromonospora sp. NBC_01813 TaxID=2975988 RepID=UPI002DD9DE04|nr:RNA ligase family protein [Micromonospora sp. NBC_01813]WSA11518.1 RNA ligase family protein [Micromonospora sp. NBC_01813]